MLQPAVRDSPLLTAVDHKPVGTSAVSNRALWGGLVTPARSLAPLFSWFTEGFETADLKATKALLDELRSMSGFTLVQS